MTESSFSTLNLDTRLIKNLDDLGYTSMTSIQQQSLPAILKGQDVIGQSKTGSGKTVAFGLGLLSKIDAQKREIQSLILCPTRELADQVANELRKLARVIPNVKILLLCGGTPFGPQKASLEFGAHIVVGTPGRIEDHLNKRTLDLSAVKTLVLDEADRMLDMGFQPAIEFIAARLPEQRQTLLFSATFPDGIKFIAKKLMALPTTVRVETSHHEGTITQFFYKITNDFDRMSALRVLLQHYQPESTIVFCNTKKETQDLANELNQYGFSNVALHGDLEQNDRNKAMVQFSNKSVSVLVATDVAARGLDIDSVDAVCNFHIARDSEVHVHRIGRTGRANNKGIAINLYSDKEQFKVDRLGDQLKINIQDSVMPKSDPLAMATFKPLFTTIQIDGGKKQKLRAGDILGALTSTKNIAGDQIGKIHLYDHTSFVAVKRDLVKAAVDLINNGKLKGRSFRARILHSK